MNDSNKTSAHDSSPASSRLGRRAMLGSVAGAGALAAFAGPLSHLIAQARPSARRVVLCEFNGAWDVLLGPDPRDPARSFPGIHLGTSLLPAEYRDPFEARVGSERTLLGPTMRALSAHGDVATIFRGVNMNTVAHPTGQAYMNTCLLPSGSNARGSSLGTVFASAGNLGAEGPILPYVSIGLRSYNDRYPREASALRLARARDLSPMLGGPSQQLPDSIEALLAAAQADAASCIGPAYRGEDPALEQQLSRERLERLRVDNFASRFAFGADTPQMQAVRTLYGFPASAADTLPAVRAATAARLVKSGLARAVSVRLQQGLDTHSNWGTLHPPRLQEGFDAMAAMLTDLREDDPNMEHTTVVAFSDFARTPRINGNEGRDHWFAGSVLVFGGLRPGVFGATNPDDLGLLRVDPMTGRPVESGGMQLKPEHIAATLVTASGLDASAYRVDPLPSLMI